MPFFMNFNRKLKRSGQSLPEIAQIGIIFRLEIKLSFLRAFTNDDNTYQQK